MIRTQHQGSQRRSWELTHGLQLREKGSRPQKQLISSWSPINMFVHFISLISHVYPMEYTKIPKLFFTPPTHTVQRYLYRLRDCKRAEQYLRVSPVGAVPGGRLTPWAAKTLAEIPVCQGLVDEMVEAQGFPPQRRQCPGQDKGRATEIKPFWQSPKMRKT